MSRPGNSSLTTLLASKEFKLAFFDLDGTLINSKEEISPDTRNALAKLTDSGIQVALATGRPYFGAKWVIDQLKISSPSLFFSGALIINPTGTDPLSQQIIPRAALVSLVKFARQAGLYLELYTVNEYVVDKTGPFTAVHESYLGVRARQADLAEFSVDNKVLKAVFITDTERHTQMVAEFMAKMDSLACATGTGARHPGVLFHNITVHSASRSNAFKELMKIYNLEPKQVMAFGDASSDIPFIELAGLGVAMGNAPKDVQLAADYVTASVDEDGIAKVIKALLG